jgi:hypothetical protein
MATAIVTPFMRYGALPQKWIDGGYFGFLTYTNLASRGEASSDGMKGTKKGRLLLTSCYAAFTTNYIP